MTFEIRVENGLFQKVDAISCLRRHKEVIPNYTLPAETSHVFFSLSLDFLILHSVLFCENIADERFQHFRIGSNGLMMDCQLLQDELSRVFDFVRL